MPLFSSLSEPGLLLRIRSDSSDAQKDLALVRTGIKDLTDNIAAKVPGAAGRIASLGSELIAIPGPAGIAAGAIAGLAAVAATVAAATFAAAKSASEYGDELFDMAQKTGVGTDALQALKVAADQSGSSLESIQNQLTKFTVLLGKAEQGNDKAVKTLEKYHITARDVNGALAQAITTISSLTSAEEQNAAAAELFKDRGGAVINVIREMDGDLAGAIKRLREMGILMEKEDVEAAAELADTLDDLHKQFTAIWRVIGTAVIPVVARLARDFSSFLTDHKEDIKNFAEFFAKTLTDSINQVKKELLELQNIYDVVAGKSAQARIASNFSIVPPSQLDPGAPIRQLHEDALKQSRQRILTMDYIDEVLAGRKEVPGIKASVPDYSRPGDFKSKKKVGAEDEDVKAAREKAEKERLELQKRAASASIDLLQIHLKQQETDYAKHYENLLGLVKSGESTAEQAKEEARQYDLDYTQERARTYNKLAEAQFKLAGLEKKTEQEVNVIRQKHNQEVLADSAKRQEQFDKFNEDAIKAEGKIEKERVESNKRTTEQKIALHENATRRAIADQELELAQGKTNEEDFNRFVQLAEEEMFRFKIKKLTELQANTKKGSEEEVEIIKQIGEAKTQQYELEKKGQAEVFLTRKRNAQELLELQQKIRDIEEEIFDNRAREARAQLNKAVDKAVGPVARRKALEELRVFEEYIETERHKRFEEDLEREKKAALERVKGKENEEKQKLEIEKLYQERRLLGEEEFQRRLKKIKEGFEEDTDPFKHLKDSWNEFKDAVLESADLESTFAGIGQMGMDLLNGMIEATKTAAANWILYGDAIGPALKKALAAQLATIAVEAGIRALMATAMGFYLLATHQYKAAGDAFTSAALWAAVAVGAGAAARAIMPKEASKAQSSGGSASSGSKAQDMTPISRYSNEAGRSGNPLVDIVQRSLDRHAAATEALASKIDSMPAHEVVTRAEDQRPGIVAGQTVKGLESNATQGIKLRRTLLGG